MQNTPDKIRVGFYIEKELLKKCDMFLDAADARSRNEFVNNAIRQYLGYMQSQGAQSYLSSHLTSALTGIIKLSEDRISRLLFKLAVEVSMMMHVIAETTDMGEGYLRKLRGKCVEDVKKSIGAITFDEVVKKSNSE